jgi:HD-like signal output (HDOD) protein
MPTHTAQELALRTTELVTLPAIYHRVKEVFDDPEGSVLDLAKVVVADPGITMRVLRVVNSVFYGFPGKVETMSRAVSVLGMQQVHDIVLATTVTAVFSGMRPERMDVTRFWRASAMRGLLSRAAAKSCGLLDAERLFVGGLLADIGHMVMYMHAPKQAEQALVESRTTGVAPEVIERELIGCDYAQVGEALLRAWQLPTSFAVAIGAQLDPIHTVRRTNSKPACCTWRGAPWITTPNSLIRRASSPASLPTAWHLTRLEPQAFEGACAEASSSLAAVMGLFFPEYV